MTRTILKMQDVDLGGEDLVAIEKQLCENRERGDMIRWYLYARVVERFFARWPQLKDIDAYNDGYDDTPAISFIEGQRVDPQSQLSEDARRRLTEDLESLADDTTFLTDGGILPCVFTMVAERTIAAEGLMDTFARLWGRDKSDPALASQKWAGLVAEVASVQLDEAVDPAGQTRIKAPTRM